MKDIGTARLPDEVVNEEFSMLITNASTDPANRIGKTALAWMPSEFDENGTLLAWSGEPEYLSDREDDQLEFAAGLLRHWIGTIEEELEMRVSDEEVHAAGDSE